MPDFISFQEISSDITPESALVGGKAGALAQLYQNGFSVPNGFIVTTDFFDRFFKENDLSMSDEEIIQRYIDTCGLKGTFAVRSSASVEDSSEQSFAGQFDTFLGVKRSDVPEAIKKCWQSLHNARARTYTHSQNNIGKMAVLIQEMISPKVSGVAFSINPVTGDSNCTVIEAVLGSNELLVSGIVTPDCYMVNKDLEIIDKKTVLQKEVQMIDVKNGNIRRLSICDEQQKLSDCQIVNVARMVNSVERFFNKPVDVEWAIDDNGLYILQSRPITAIQHTHAANIF